MGDRVHMEERESRRELDGNRWDTEFFLHLGCWKS
jgi:hypothetical protein